MKVGVYVGSFNPVHKGHENIVEYLLKEKYLDKIIIIPTLNYWDKQNLINIEARTHMLNLVFKNNNIIVDNSLSKYEYTYEILNHLKEKSKADELYLIIGADNIINFHKWKNVDSILENYVIIIPRDDIDIKKYIKKYKQKDKFILTKDFKCENISSTIIRENLINGKLKCLNNIIDEHVLDYIVKEKIYEVI